jgi:DNA helicase-2/ATP-dependent DNA helicase PcrA
MLDIPSSTPYIYIMLKKINYKKSLNPQQIEAVTSTDGSYLVIAGAGTGKTRTLIYRVAHLIEQGIDPKSILLLTFTRRAAQEMMRRASDLLDERCNHIQGGTFHSFCAATLRRFPKEIGYSPGFTILDQADSEDIIGSILEKINLTPSPFKLGDKKAIVAILSRRQNTGKSFSEIVQEDYPQFVGFDKHFQDISSAFLRFKADREMMDYDDLLLHTVKLLKTSKSVRKFLSLENRYIMVDEYQDTNSLQAEIVRFLASEHGNVMVVGDDAQSIYSFRGANFKNIIDFEKIFPGTIVIRIEQNYRSTQPILDLTNSIITNFKEKYDKALFTDRPGGNKPIFTRPETHDEQSNYVVTQVRDILQSGVSPCDVAVLFRAGYNSNNLEVALTSSQIPFIKYGGFKFMQTAHIKDLISILRLALNPLDEVCWHRILGQVKGIGTIGANAIIEKMLEQGTGLDALSEIRAKKDVKGEALSGLCDQLSLIGEASRSPEDAVNLALDYYENGLKRRFENFDARLRDLESLRGIAKKYNSLQNLISDLLLEAPETEQDNKDSLVLSTVHSAKGLEWKHVFVISLLEGTFPSFYSLQNRDAIEEERRLFYVATTRAKEGLHLIMPRLSDKGYNTNPSRFLVEMRDMIGLTDEVCQSSGGKWEVIPEAARSRLESKYASKEPEPARNKFYGKLTDNGKGKFVAKGRESYEVDLKAGTCTCPAFTYRMTRPCKHLLAAQKKK